MGNRIVKAFCREDYEIERFHRENLEFFRLRMKNVSTRAVSPPVMELLGGFGIAAIMFYGGLSGNRTVPPRRAPFFLFWQPC